MTTFVILGGGGGLVAVLGAIIMVGRGVFRQISATEANTRALQELTGQVESLRKLQASHEIRIAVLEDRVKR